MKKSTLLVVVLLLAFPPLLNAQVGIGTTNPKALLHIKANASVPDNQKGIILPKVSLLPTGIIEEGMFVFLDSNDTAEGIYFYNGTKWEKNDNAWRLGGNKIQDGEFIGTTNQKDLNFKVDNKQRLEIGAAGDLVYKNSNDKKLIEISRDGDYTINNGNNGKLIEITKDGVITLPSTDLVDIDSNKSIATKEYVDTNPNFISSVNEDTSEDIINFNKGIRISNLEYNSINTVKGGELIYDKNFHNDNGYGTGSGSPINTFTGDGGGLVIYNEEDGWSALFDTRNIKYANIDAYNLKVQGNQVWHAGNLTSEDVSYDNSDSGLTATNVKDAIDELASSGGGSGGGGNAVTVVTGNQLRPYLTNDNSRQTFLIKNALPDFRSINVPSPQVDGKIITIIRASSNDIRILTRGNIELPFNKNITITQNTANPGVYGSSITLVYSSNERKWFVISIY